MAATSCYSERPSIEKSLFIKNISHKINEEILYELFLQAGPLESCVVALDRDRQRTAQILYKHIESVEYARKIFDNTLLYGSRLQISTRPPVDDMAEAALRGHRAFDDRGGHDIPRRDDHRYNPYENRNNYEDNHRHHRVNHQDQHRHGRNDRDDFDRNYRNGRENYDRSYIDNHQDHHRHHIDNQQDHHRHHRDNHPDQHRHDRNDREDYDRHNRSNNHNYH